MDNAEKNTYTKKQLTEALLRLLEERELRGISVQDLADAAGVHRVSFYRNYREKEDILRDYMNTTYRDWEAAHPPVLPPVPDEGVFRLFSYLNDYKEFYGLMYRRGLLALLKEVMRTNVGPRPEFSNHLAYVTAFLANGIYGWVEEWVARGMQESAQEMAELLQQQIQPGQEKT